MSSKLIPSKNPTLLSENRMNTSMKRGRSATPGRGKTSDVGKTIKDVGNSNKDSSNGVRQRKGKNTTTKSPLPRSQSSVVKRTPSPSIGTSSIGDRLRGFVRIGDSSPFTPVKKTPTKKTPFGANELFTPPHSCTKGESEHSPPGVPWRAVEFRRNIEFIEKPRSVLMAGLLTMYVFYVALIQNTSQADLSSVDDYMAHIKNAIAVLFCINIIYCVLNLRDSQYTIRPHPAFWRFVHGAALFYFYFLVVLTIIPPEMGKALIQSTGSTTNMGGDKAETNDAINIFREIFTQVGILSPKIQSVTDIGGDSLSMASSSPSSSSSVIGISNSKTELTSSKKIEITSSDKKQDKSEKKQDKRQDRSEKEQDKRQDKSENKSNKGDIGNWHLQCEITPSTIWRQLTSLWFFAHIIGWWGKMCVFRDWGLCIAYSVIFEAAELSFQSVIAEFQECWWDSIFLDVLSANMIGMYLGWETIKRLECRSYNWTSWEAAKSMGVKSRIKRGIQQFLPYSWSTYVWNSRATTFQHVLQHLGWIFGLFIELSSFFQLNCLGIPPAHFLPLARQLCLGFLAVPAQAEYYESCNKGFSVGRLGQNIWLLICITLIEIIQVTKYTLHNEKMLAKMTATPNAVKIAWIGFTLLQILYLLAHELYLRQNNKKIKNILENGQTLKYPNYLRYLKYFSFAPLMLLCQFYAY